MAGQFFRTVDGHRHTVIETTEFSLFKRYIEEQFDEVKAVLRERADIGFNTARIWLLNKSVVGRRDLIWGDRGFQDDGIHPDQYPDYYEALKDFTNLALSYGIMPEYTVFTETQLYMPVQTDQQRHLDHTAEALEGLAVLLEEVNESDQYDNRTAGGLRRPTRLWYCTGSNGADHDTVVPTADYGAYHIIGSQWQRKVGHNAMEVAEWHNIPCICNENQRHPDNNSNADWAYDAARAAALLCAGSCFHSWSGKNSTPFTMDERACAQAWADGARSVDLEFQDGAYHHRPDLEGPGIIRAYDRTLGDGRQFTVTIRG